MGWDGQQCIILVFIILSAESNNLIPEYKKRVVSKVIVLSNTYQWRNWGINVQDLWRRRVLNKLSNTSGSEDSIQLLVTLGQLRRPQPYIKKRKNKITIIAKKTNAGKLEQG